MMPTVTMRQMLEAGVHFGHQTRYWNPKMAPYIFGERNKIHIINLEKTLPLFQEALNYAKKVEDQGQIGIIYIEMGNVFLHQENAQKANDLYEKAITTLEKASLHSELARAHNNLGYSLTLQEDWESAIRHLEISMKEAEEIGDLQMKAWAQSSIGEAYLQMGSLIKARENLDEGMRFLKKIGDKTGLCEFYHLFGMYHTKKHEWDEGEEYFENCIALAKELDNPKTLAKAYEELGKMYVIKGDKQPAKKNLDEAVKIYKQLGLDDSVEELEEYVKLQAL